jgi:hypothetical protein
MDSIAGLCAGEYARELERSGKLARGERARKENRGRKAIGLDVRFESLEHFVLAE